MSIPIAIQDLRKVFGTGSTASAAVDGVTIAIQPGELFFLLGPSGCGKTTLLRMIAGFIEPTAGCIMFGDRDVTWLPPNRRNTGMVFQSYALWPHMTVEANVAFGLGIRKVPRDTRNRRVAEALAAVQMTEYARRKPNQLSGGQQQRVALARALVVRPDVLLLDEPLSNLDAKLRNELRSEIRRICKDAGITTVYVTHDQKEALSMADRVAIMSRGRVVQLGTPRDLYRQPASRFVAEFLGETNVVPGRLIESSATGATVETPVGQLRTGVTSQAVGAEVLCSIRPEALRLAGNGGNTLSGRLVESVYLGETAQYLVELPGGIRTKVASLNPTEVAGAVGETVSVSVAPGDVVVLPCST
jgi:iron(III) transport system ATP-binding protein